MGSTVVVIVKALWTFVSSSSLSCHLVRDELAGHASVAVSPEHLLAAVVAVGGQQGGGLLKPATWGSEQWVTPSCGHTCDSL